MEVVGGLCVRQHKAWCCSPGDLAPAATPSLTYSPLPLSPLLPWIHLPTGGAGVSSFMVGLVLVDVITFRVSLPRLTEFQTPTIFDHNRNFKCNTFYRLHKIVKIIDYTSFIIEMYL